MNYSDLRERVCSANRALPGAGLVVLTWGNVSEVDRDAGVFAIKPSGVAYHALTPASICVISLETGMKVDGPGNPSSDTPTHWELYRSFPAIGGIAHAHSTYATVWAQASCEIPCLGTTHADLFHGPVPCTRILRQAEVAEAYELNTGKLIVDHFAERALPPMEMPGVLVGGHGPFTWGCDAHEAVDHAIVMEEVARMAALTIGLNPQVSVIQDYVLEKHYLRKHGAGAYYGQHTNGGSDE